MLCTGALVVLLALNDALVVVLDGSVAIVLRVVCDSPTVPQLNTTAATATKSILRKSRQLLALISFGGRARVCQVVRQ